MNLPQFLLILEMFPSALLEDLLFIKKDLWWVRLGDSKMHR